MEIAVPDDLDIALTPSWLTSALRQRFPGVAVHTVRRGPVVERFSTNARFTIDGSLTADVPRHLCIKGYFSDIGHAIAFVGEPEACFYRDLAERTGIRTLRPVWADVNPATRHGVVITRDEAEAGGDFLDGNSPFTVEAAAEALTELARLHASTWKASEWSSVDWLRPRLGYAAEMMGEEYTLKIMSSNLNGLNGIGVPSKMREARALLEAHRQLSARTPGPSSDDWCVIHGDAHVGNIMTDRDGRPWLVDWQLVQRGFWQVDVGYLIAATLTAEQRRPFERELLRHYLDRLAAFGVAAPRFDDAWPLLIDGMIHGFFFWAITTKVNPEIIAVLLGRLGTAVADHSATQPS